MSLLEAVVLLLGGAAAGIINSMAGGGSLITVPLLDIVGVAGLDANGTNRMAVLAQNASSSSTYRKQGVGGLREAVPVVLPVVIGSLVGAVLVSQLADDSFRRLFGVLMVPLLLLALIRRPQNDDGARPWSPGVSAAIFFVIGVYGGAIQAGVGLVLLMAINRSGIDLLKANAIKTVVILALTLVAVPVFILDGQVRWFPALILAIGTGVGGWLGARIAVKGGERVIKPVLVVAVIALAGRMLGLY
ncbi:MAG: sulfite exporter TauE/SafE family protein [Actinomycetia bacterium]|nr:sulfite exporter TauE/SafE family protein [Actinomycetes bacterium]